MKKKLLGMLIAAFAIGAFAACSRSEPEPEATELGATAQGFIDWIGVELIMDGDRIVNIDVDWNAESPAWIDMIYGPNRQIVQDVIDRQGTDGIVTAGSGATVSANAFLTAVNEVLERLGMEVGEIYVPADIDPDDVERPARQFEDGPYTASAIGWAEPGRTPGPTQGTEPIFVRVNFNADNTRIESIDFDSFMETPAFAAMAQVTIDEIVERQTTEGIDAGSGATVTSQAILNAVQEVLDRVNFVASEIEDEIVDEDEIVGEDEDEPADDPAPPTAADTTPPAEVTPPVAAGRFNPGSFRGTSNDTYSHNPDNDGGLTPTPLVVEITVDDNNITGLTIVSHGETQGFVNMTNAMQQAIVANNGTAGVSATSGATYTARAIIEAAEAAIAAAER